MLKLLFGGCSGTGYRLQTKDNLRKRGILPGGATSQCPFCEEEEEGSNHLFFTCRFSYSVWCSCYSWFGFESVLPEDWRSHFNQHVRGFCNLKQRAGFVAVWCVVVWCLWCHRNNVIFRGESVDRDVRSL